MILRKSNEAALGVNSGESVLSTETKDRYGDIIRVTGWKLASFKQNSIALFNHDQSLPVGTWENIRVVGKTLVATYRPAPRGVSLQADEINALTVARVINGVSVGFKPLKSRSLPDGSGVEYLEQELLEASLVSVPANPDALMTAKALGVSPKTIEKLFGRPPVNASLSQRQDFARARVLARARALLNDPIMKEARKATMARKSTNDPDDIFSHMTEDEIFRYGLYLHDQEQQRIERAIKSSVGRLSRREKTHASGYPTAEIEKAGRAAFDRIISDPDRAEDERESYLIERERKLRSEFRKSMGLD
jgi:HK97 family phage prohead protease